MNVIRNQSISLSVLKQDSEDFELLSGCRDSNCGENGKKEIK
jgi:hypothetical protein